LLLKPARSRCGKGDLLGASFVEQREILLRQAGDRRALFGLRDDAHFN